MKLGATKIFLALTIAFAIVALGSTTQPPKPKGCGNPPWSDPGGKCVNKQNTYIFVSTVNWPLRKETDCSFYLHVCSLVIKRNSVESLGAKCLEAKDFAQPVICCDEFNKAVKTKQPCDPMKDADCDGLPNDTDPDPLGARDPDADDKCKQLGFDVYLAYHKAGANDSTAMDAGADARHDCKKRRTDKNCGIPAPEPPDDPTPTFSKDPDTDNKCKELGQEVFEAYLAASAARDTALHAGEVARHDCYRKRANKL